MSNPINELKKLKSQRTLAIGFGLMFVCLGMWLIISIGSTSRQSQIEPELIKMAKPLNPTLDMTILAKIETKRYMSTAELSGFPIYVIDEDPVTKEEILKTITPQTENRDQLISQ